MDMKQKKQGSIIPKPNTREGGGKEINQTCNEHPRKWIQDVNHQQNYNKEMQMIDNYKFPLVEYRIPARLRKYGLSQLSIVS